MYGFRVWGDVVVEEEGHDARAALARHLVQVCACDRKSHFPYTSVNLFSISNIS